MLLPLTASDYATILSLYKSTKDKRIANYLNIIILKHKGYRQVEIADILNLDANTICTWIGKFEQSKNLEDYLTLNYTAYLGKLSYSYLGKLDAIVANSTYSDTKPIISEVEKCFGIRYSRSGISKLLTRLGFSYKAKVALPSKLDVAKQAVFIEKYAEIERNLTAKCVIFFMDAVHPQHNTHTLKAWLRKGKPSYILTNSGRNRLNINGLYNPHTQETIVNYHKTINAQATIETFEKLKTHHPDKENLYIFADNAKYYVSKVLKAYLAENPQLKLIHLPAYSPNLNLIERLWKYLRKEIINPNYYEKFEQFSLAIEKFFDSIHNKKDEIAQFIGTKFRMFDFA
jgi:transposase